MKIIVVDEPLHPKEYINEGSNVVIVDTTPKRILRLIVNKPNLSGKEKRRLRRKYERRKK